MCHLNVSLKSCALNNSTLVFTITGRHNYFSLFFFLFCTFYSFFRLQWKNMLKVGKDYFNQQTACKAPICWSKYTTNNHQGDFMENYPTRQKQCWKLCCNYYLMKLIFFSPQNQSKRNMNSWNNLKWLNIPYHFIFQHYSFVRHIIAE